MIPTSYIVKNLYAERWGNPANPHAVDVPVATPTHPRGKSTLSLVALVSSLRQRLARRQLVLGNGLEQPCS